MDSLINGYKRFRATDWPEQKRHFEALAENGQRPKAMVVTCIDSRLDPALVFNAAPGELLIVRNVANLIPPYAPDADYHGTSAALEFGIRILNIPSLIVLGHGLCGGVRALIEGIPDTTQDFIGPWMSIAKKARTEAMHCTTPDERQLSCEHGVIKTSLANLMTYPWIAEKVAQKKLTLNGGWFAIHTGTLEILQDDGSFKPL